MTDRDIHAFGAPPVAPAPEARRRQFWPWVLGAALLMLVLTAAVGSALLASVAGGLEHGLNVTLNGEHWEPVGLTVGQSFWAMLGVALALMSVLLVLLVVVPLSVLAGLLAAALGIGIAMLAVAAAAAVLLSPLWLPVLLLWLLLRRGSCAAARMRP